MLGNDVLNFGDAGLEDGDIFTAVAKNTHVCAQEYACGDDVVNIGNDFRLLFRPTFAQCDLSKRLPETDIRVLFRQTFGQCDLSKRLPDSGIR